MLPGLPPLMVIETITLGGSAATVKLPASGTIADIAPSGSRHIVVLVQGRSAADPGVARDNFQLQFNEDTGANYHTQYFAGLGSSASCGIGSFTYGLMQGSSAGSPSNAMSGGAMLIPHAFNTANFKSAIVLGGADEDIVQTSHITWANAAAITDVTVGSLAGDLAAGTIVKLCVVDESYLVTDGEEILTGTSAFTNRDVPSQVGDISIINYCRSARAATNDGLALDINGDTTATNYGNQALQAYTSSVSAAANQYDNNQIGGCNGNTSDSNYFSAAITTVNAFNYGDNDPHCLTLSGYRSVSTADAAALIYSMRRNNVAAVTSVNVTPTVSSTFLAGSGQWVYAVPKTLLERKTITGDTASVTFTLSDLSIPSTVKDLRVNFYGRSTHSATSVAVDMDINGDTTSANYDNQFIYGYASTIAALQQAADRYCGSVAAATETANLFNGGSILFPNYASTDRTQHYLHIYGEGESRQMGINSGRWENTAAIATLKFAPRSGSWAAGSVIELEGIGNGWMGTLNGVENPGKVNGTHWAGIETLFEHGSTAFSASGGTETTYTSGGKNYKVHTFTSSGTFTVSGARSDMSADFLVVAGGASNSSYGGGGAGGFRTSSGTSGANSAAESKATLSAQAYSIVVGAGGAVAGGSSRETDAGDDSVALGITSVGGGVGVGGSGGGSTDHSGSGSAGTANQGMAGGDGNGGGPYSGGGGGGAGAVGQDASSADAGNGGAGLANSLRTGSGVDYAGGGGGGTYAPNGANQGGTASHGGGAGGAHQGSGAGTNFYAGVAGTVNTGGGGGCVDAGMVYGEGNNGGSGIVVIRYLA